MCLTIEPSFTNNSPEAQAPLCATISSDMHPALVELASMTNLLPDEQSQAMRLLLNGLFDCHARVVGLENMEINTNEWEAPDTWDSLIADASDCGLHSIVTCGLGNMNRGRRNDIFCNLTKHFSVEDFAHVFNQPLEEIKDLWEEDCLDDYICSECNGVFLYAQHNGLANIELSDNGDFIRADKDALTRPIYIYAKDPTEGLSRALKIANLLNIKVVDEERVRLGHAVRGGI